MLGFLLFQVGMKSIRAGPIQGRKGIIIRLYASEKSLQAKQIKPEFLKCKCCVGLLQFYIIYVDFN